MWISSDKVLAELSSIRKKCFKVWKILALKSFIEFLMFSSFIINASLRNPRRSSERVVGPSWKLSGLFGIELVNLNFHATAQASTHFLSMSLKMWCLFRCRQTISELGLLIFCALLSITGQRNCSCSHNSIISTLKTECEADLCRDSNPTIRSKYPEEGNCWSATGQRRRRCECSRRNLNRKKRIQRRNLEDMHVSREVDRKGVEIRKFQILAMSNTLNIQRDWMKVGSQGNKTRFLCMNRITIQSYVLVTKFHSYAEIMVCQNWRRTMHKSKTKSWSCAICNKGMLQKAAN
jgi:hypothetical protein